MPCQDPYPDLELGIRTEQLCRLCGILERQGVAGLTLIPQDIKDWFERHQEQDRKRIAAEMEVLNAAAQGRRAALRGFI
jgi:hypothetical protein